MTTRVPIGAGMNSTIRIACCLFLLCAVFLSPVAADDPGPCGGVRVVRPASETGGRESVDGRLRCFDEDSKRLMTKEVLDTGELLRAAGTPHYREEFLRRFPEIVKTTVQPTEWEDVGGSCRLEPTGRPRDGRFVVTATPSIRREITTLIRTMVDATKAKSPVSLVLFLTENAEAIKAVERPVTLDVVDAPLREVLGEIGRQIGMSIALDRPALDEMGIVDTDIPVTIHCRGLRASDALAQFLSDLELTCSCLDGGLVVTWEECAMSRLSTSVFDVHDLVMRKDGTPDLDSLIGLVTTTIEPTTWDRVGGPGSVRAVCLEEHTLLVVSQTQEVPQEIKSLLDRARLAKKEYHPVLRRRHEEWATFAKVLDRRVRWHFDEVPLDEAMATVSAALGVDVHLDRGELDEMGIGSQAPLSLPAGEYVAGDALARMLGPREATCVIARGGLMITTRDEASLSYLETALFDVSDLVLFGEADSRRAARHVKTSTGAEAVQFRGASPPDLPLAGNCDTLIDCVKTVVCPTTWHSGEIKEMEAEKQAFLVVRQTQEVLDRITRFFEALRKIQKTKAKAIIFESNAGAAVPKRLDRRVAWSLNEPPLSRHAFKIAAVFGVDVATHLRSPDETGLEPDPTRLPPLFVYFDAREALGRARKIRNLSYFVENGTVVMTTEEDPHKFLTQALFNITDLLASGKATEDGLVEAIRQTVQPETWDCVGGPGSLGTLSLPGGQTVLAVAQTDEVLHEVERRLEKLRKQ